MLYKLPNKTKVEFSEFREWTSENIINIEYFRLKNLKKKIVTVLNQNAIV